VVGIKPITAWEAYNAVTEFLTHQKIEARRDSAESAPRSRSPSSPRARIGVCTR
jgi:hypothetical protein